jgi:hypothetical protein
MNRIGSPLAISLSLIASSSFADPPKIDAVAFDGRNLSVTISHPDTGWDHYADLWTVYDPSGTQIAKRVLLHPHETEQPFTRATALPEMPAGTILTIVASCTDGDRSEPYQFTIAGK